MAGVDVRAGARARPDRGFRRHAVAQRPRGPLSGTLTRRALLRAGAALALAGTGVTRLVSVSSGTRRTRTYVALVEAVGIAGRSQVDPARAHAAARALESHYRAALPPTRRAIDAVLDELGGLRFAALDPQVRLELLRRLADDPRRADLAARAVALAALPFHPPADDFHPTPVTL